MPQNIEDIYRRLPGNIRTIIAPVWIDSYLSFDSDGLVPETIINKPISYIDMKCGSAGDSCGLKSSLSIIFKSKKFKLIQTKKEYQIIKPKYYNNKRKIFRRY